VILHDCRKNLVILFVVFGWLGPGAVSAESWTDLRGTRTIDARMVGLWGDTVVLELTSGKRVSVKLDSLRSESRIQARRMAKKMDQERVQQIQDLEQTSIAAAAAAPDPIPTPEPAPPYQPPSTDLELEPYLQQIDQAIAAGHVLAIYDSLPPSHRKDVDEVVAMVLNKVDPNSFEMLIRCLHRSGMVLVTHQNWLMTSPRIEAMPESAKEQLTGPIMSLAGLLNATLDSDLASLSNMKSEPFGKWLAKFDQASCDYLHQAHRSIGRPIQRTITIESTRDEQTQVTVQSGDDQFKTTLVKVDGYWLPSSYAGPNWDQMIEDLKKAIEASDGSSLLRPLYEKAALAMPVLDTLERSSNANDFHASIESLVEFVATTLPEFSSVLGITTGRDSIRGRTDQYFDDY
jgi:hypothetical protein